jgi:hypothetical protein
MHNIWETDEGSKRHDYEIVGTVESRAPDDLEKEGYTCEVRHEPTEISCSYGLHLFSCTRPTSPRGQ